MKYRVHKDGSFDLLGNQISLYGCYPCVDGFPLRVVGVKVEKEPAGIKPEYDTITYQLSTGSVRISLRTDMDQSLELLTSASGLVGIHDLSPLGNAVIDGAESVFVQGFGMEGPSGCFSLSGADIAASVALNADIPVSHGLSALYIGDHVLLTYAKDHRRYSVAFQSRKRPDAFSRNLTRSSGKPLFDAVLNLECTADDDISLPSLYFEEAVGLSAGLTRCAEKIAAEMKARQSKPPAFFWSSWYYAYETMDQATLEERLSGIRAEKVPFEYIELDAGYTPSEGDWLLPNHRWPGGLKKGAETIINAGFKAGIWVAPFIVGDRSVIYRDHPDWVLHDLEGRPLVQLTSYTEPKMWGNPDCDYYVLDTSNPEALAYIEHVFKNLRSWGFTFFKTDFMLWNMHDSSTVKRYNPRLTSVEILRMTLATIRGAIGEDNYLLGCIAPFMPYIGYADGMRLAGDCGAQWAETFGPVNMLRELPCDNYFNHIFWQNDPDAMLLRDFATKLSNEEARSLTLLQALSGGVVSTSDPVDRLSKERRDLLQMVEPHGKVRAELPYFGQNRKELVLIHHLSQGKLLFIMNPTDQAVTVYERLSDLFGDQEWYQHRYQWNGEDVNPQINDLVLLTLEAHSSELFFITDKPLEKKPDNLWIW